MDVFVCCECHVLSGRGLYDGLITRPEESYRLWCVVVCHLETSWMRRPWPTGSCCAKNIPTKMYTACFSETSCQTYEPTRLQSPVDSCCQKWKACLRDLLSLWIFVTLSFFLCFLLHHSSTWFNLVWLWVFAEVEDPSSIDFKSFKDGRSGPDHCLSNRLYPISFSLFRQVSE
jgi:hypothetical protein